MLYRLVILQCATKKYKYFMQKVKALLNISRTDISKYHHMIKGFCLHFSSCYLKLLISQSKFSGSCFYLYFSSCYLKLLISQSKFSGSCFYLHFSSCYLKLLLSQSKFSGSCFYLHFSSCYLKLLISQSKFSGTRKFTSRYQ